MGWQRRKQGSRWSMPKLQGSRGLRRPEERAEGAPLLVGFSGDLERRGGRARSRCSRERQTAALGGAAMSEEGRDLGEHTAVEVGVLDGRRGPVREEERRTCACKLWPEALGQ